LLFVTGFYENDKVSYARLLAAAVEYLIIETLPNFSLYGSFSL